MPPLFWTKQADTYDKQRKDPPPRGHFIALGNRIGEVATVGALAAHAVHVLFFGLP
jgi:hypothetical protein